MPQFWFSTLSPTLKMTLEYLSIEIMLKFKNLQNDLTYCKSDILMFNQIVFC